MFQSSPPVPQSKLTQLLTLCCVAIFYFAQSPALAYDSPTVTETNLLPKARIYSIMPIVRHEGDTITFKGISSDYDGSIVKYQWASNQQGIIGHSQNVEVTSLKAGFHSITFLVQDNDGEWSTPSRFTIVVLAAQNTTPTQTNPPRDDSVVSTTPTQATEADVASFDEHLSEPTNIVVNTQPVLTNPSTSTPKEIEIIIDNDDPGTNSIGSWAISSSDAYYGDSSVFGRDGAEFTWSAALPLDGDYGVYLWWTNKENRSDNVIYTINHATGNSDISVNQQLKGGQWNYAGDFYFTSSQQASITLNAPQSYPISYSADAVKFVRKINDIDSQIAGTITNATLIDWDSIQNNGNQIIYVENAIQFHEATTTAEPGDYIVILTDKNNVDVQNISPFDVNNYSFVYRVQRNNTGICCVIEKLVN